MFFLASILLQTNMSDNNFRKGPHTAKNKPLSAQRSEIIDGSVPSSDERKTVILDEDLEGVEFEDKVWLYWIRNKNFILGTVAAAFIIVIGVQGWKLYVANKNAKLASEYEAASTPSQLEEFAKDNSGTKLAGVALIQNADGAYAEGKYDQAQKFYAQAQKDLSKTVLLGRAKLGEAVCMYISGDKEKSESALKSLFDDASIAQTYRAQAGYLLGLAQKQAGKIAEAKETLKKVSEEHGDGIFAQIAQETLSQIE